MMRLRGCCQRWCLRGYTQKIMIRVACCLFISFTLVFPAIALPPDNPTSSTPPTTQTYTLEDIQRLENLKAQAFEATQQGDFAQAETYWTQLIEAAPNSAALWSNRGNVRAGQRNLEGAIADYTHAIELAPEEPDPYLNRGAVYEALAQWEDAIADYNHLLEGNPKDAAAFNNRGNAKGGAGNWEGAIADYTHAAELDTNFVLPQMNRALALYQVGETDEAIQALKGLARKYPRFADARAALTAVLWDQGQQGEAESNWVSANGLDGRYKDIDWVAEVRRWPPKLVDALDRFLKIET